MKTSDKIHILNVIPSSRDGISTYLGDEGKVTLGIQRFKSKWINKYFMPKRISPDIKVPLDSYGSAVWVQIDGKATISEIIQSVQEVYPEEENLEERIIQYLYHLRKDKLIDFTIK